MSRLRSRAGLTLIETLLAVAIGALVVVLAYTTYHAALATLSGQTARASGRTAAVHAVAEVARNLSCGVPADDDAGCGFALAPDGTGPDASSLLSFCSAVRPEGEDPAWYEIRQLAFRVGGEGERRDLLRVDRRMVGPETAEQTNVLVEGVARFRVEAFDGAEWLEKWPEESSAQWPRAARISLSLGQGGVTSFTAEVWIPVADAVTSRIERAAQAAARQPTPLSTQEEEPQTELSTLNAERSTFNAADTQSSDVER